MTSTDTRPRYHWSPDFDENATYYWAYDTAKEPLNRSTPPPHPAILFHYSTGAAARHAVWSRQLVFGNIVHREGSGPYQPTTLAEATAVLATWGYRVADVADGDAPDR